MIDGNVPPNMKEKAKETIASTNAVERTEELITKTQLAKKLKVTTRTIDNWTNEGHIPKIKIGSQVRYSWQSVLEAINNSK